MTDTVEGRRRCACTVGSTGGHSASCNGRTLVRGSETPLPDD